MQSGNINYITAFQSTSTSILVIIKAKKAESSLNEDESSSEGNIGLYSVGEYGLSKLFVTTSRRRCNWPQWAISIHSFMTTAQNFSSLQFSPQKYSHELLTSSCTHIIYSSLPLSSVLLSEVSVTHGQS